VNVDLSEFRSAYLAEMDEHLGAIRTSLLAVESAAREGRGTARELRDLMRLLHTVKGLSAMVGIEPVVTLAHRMENVVRAAERGTGTLPEAAVEALLAGTRAIETRVADVAAGRPVVEASETFLAKLDAFDVHGAAAAEAPQTVELEPELAAKLGAAEKEQLREGVAAGRRAMRIDFAPSPAKADAGLTITSLRERLATIGEIVRVVPLPTPASASAPGGLVFVLLLLTSADENELARVTGVAPDEVREVIAARPLPAPAAASRGAAPEIVEPAATSDREEEVEVQRGGVLRVEVGRIDDAIEKLSALIVTRSRLARAILALRETGAPTRELEAIMADNVRQLRDLRAAILRVRMVPVTAVLDRVPLVVRGLARTTGKQVGLEVLGGNAELDKTVAERIFPALVHLLRNAVDHGIESPDDRIRAGKSPEGKIIITSVARNNRQIEIRIEDDGRGIDRARVAEKARAEVPPDDVALLELLCRPGLSTRDTADQTSGRGVGMDVVRKIVVDGLGGELALETTPGRGTTFVLRAPLTIAIVDAFTVRCAGERFVVPVPVVEEIVEIDPAKLVSGPRVRGAEMQLFVRRGETVAVVDLAQALGLRASTLLDPEVTREGATRQALVVRRTHDEPVAFAIDRVLGQQETVVRPLADPLVSVPGVSGSTDLGDGRATLVLDLLGLCARVAPTRGHAA